MGEIIVGFGIFFVFMFLVGFIGEWLQVNNKATHKTPTQQNSKATQGNKTSTTSKTFDNYKVSTCDSDIELLDAKDLQTIQRCLADGADINARDRDGNTALMRCDDFRLEVAEYLIERGADMEAKDNFGNTALIRASSAGFLGASIAWLRRYGLLGSVMLLVEAGADVNAKENNGQTALIRTVCYYSQTSETIYFEIVKYLISKGADVNIKDNNGKTALYYAVNEGQKLDMVKFLVENGADVNAVYETCKTALLDTDKLDGNSQSINKYLVDLCESNAT
ncbi:ankyrin repeat domain-containing protein [Helicobacter sp. 23-1045]